MKISKLVSPVLACLALRNLLLGGAFIAAVSSPAYGQKLWDGSTDNLWTVGDNWSGGTAPGAGSDVTFDGSGINLATSLNGTARTINTLTFTSGQTAQVTITTTNTAALTIDSSAAITVAAGDHRFIGTNGGTGTAADLIFTGTSPIVFDITGGASFDINGKISGNKNFQKTGTGTLIISSNNGGGTLWSLGTFTVQQGILRLASSGAIGNSGNDYIVNSGAAMELTGGVTQNFGTLGTVRISGTGISAAGAIRSTSGDNSINLGAGLTLAADSSIGVDADSLAISSAIEGGFSLTKVGAGTLTLTGTNTYTGATNVNAGTLLVNGSHTGVVGAYSVANGATLGGTGSTTAALNIAGTLSPGASIGIFSGGTLDLQATSTFEYELDSSASAGFQADVQRVNGDLLIAGGAELTLGDLAVAGAPFAPGTTFTLMNYSGIWTDGDFLTFGGDVISNNGQFTAGLNTWELQYNSLVEGENNFGDAVATFPYTNCVNIVAVPEPSAMILAGLGVFGFVACRRFRRR